jgi:citrate lyase gamma subunit
MIPKYSQWRYPGEIDIAITKMIEQHFGLSRDTIVKEVARALGFRRTGATIQSVIGTRIDELALNAVIEADSNAIFKLSS